MSQGPGYPRASDAFPSASIPMVGIANFDGTQFQNVRNNAAANLGAAVQARFLGQASPGEWSTFNTPAANVQATATRAAGGAGVRHVLRSFCVTVSSNAATAANVTVNIRDGASGAGTILYSFSLALPATAGASDNFGLSDLNIIGSANTAMTIEFAAAGGAGVLETVAMSGYDTQ